MAGCVLHNLSFEYDGKADEYLENLEINSDPNECDRIVCMGSTKKDVIKRRQAIIDTLCNSFHCYFIYYFFYNKLKIIFIIIVHL